MLKKKITYTNFNDETITEDFYFNFTKAEAAEMEFSRIGGLAEHLKRVSKSEDAPEVMAIFKDVLSRAYGRRSLDGSRFIKKPEYWEEFEQSGAYSELFMELMTKPEYAAEFFTGMLPKDLAEKFANGQLQESEPENPSWIQEEREPTNNELMKMSREELILAMGKRNRQHSP